MDYQKIALTPIAPMKTGRSKHCLCYADGGIYAIGGVDEKT